MVTKLNNVRILLTLSIIILALPLVNSGTGVEIQIPESQPVSVSFFTGNLTNLSQMADVNIPSPADDEVLTFDSGTSKWISQAIATFSRWIVDTTNGFLYNNSDTLFFNDTKNNLTINQIFDTRTTDDLTEGSVNLYDNQSWNESLADTLYANISVTSGNLSFNQSLTDSLYIAQSNEGNLNVNRSDFWDDLDTINTTQMENSSGTLNILVSWFTSQWNDIFSTKDTDDLAEGSINLYDNRSWNESLADTLYANISVVDTNCSVIGSCPNVVYNLSSFDTDDLAEGTTNLYDNQSWNQSLANTLYDPLGSSNSSFNQTLTDTLYIAQSEEANLNVNRSDFWDDLDTPSDISGSDINNNLNWINFSQANNGTFINASDEGNLNVNSSDFWDDLDTINTTQMEDNGGTLNILVSWFTTQWNNIFATKDTDDLAEGSTNLYDNQSWNESLADTLYIAQSEEGNLNVNRSDFWDDLDSPADINGGDINNDLNWINQSQANTSGDARWILQSNEANLNVNSSDFWDELDSPANISGSEINNDLNWVNFSQVNNGTFINASDEANLNVNRSDFWDDLDTINATQMEDNGGTLNILVSWFTSQWNDIFSTRDTDDLTEGSINLYDNQSWNESLADTLYIVQSEEANLNVNSSDFWDDLDDPSDILGSQINNDLNWVNQSQVNTSGDGRWILQSNEGNLNVNSSDFWDGLDSPANISGSEINNDLNWVNFSQVDNGTFIKVSEEANLNVNRSDFWDDLDTINTTQMEDNSGTLNILVSWFTSQWNDIFNTKTTDDLTEGSTNLYDNQSWNESSANDLYVNVAGDTMTGNLNMSGNNIVEVNNLQVNNNATIGDRIFVNGVTELDDRLFVGIDLNQTTAVLNPGDAVFAGNVLTANGSFLAFPPNFGTSMVLFGFGDDEPGQVRFFFGANAELNTTTGRFCDTTNNPFFANSTGRVMTTISSTELLTTQISFEIISLINSSCIDVSLGALGGETVSDLTGVAYATRPAGVFEVSDKGQILANVGLGEDNSFKINTLNASGSGKFFLNTIAGTSNVLSMLLSSDANGFGEMQNIISSMRSSTAVTGSVQTNTLISGDLNNYTDGEYTGIGLEILGAGTNVSKTAIDVSSQFDTIITIAQEESISRAYYDDTSTTVDITNQLNDSSTTTTLFEDNGSIVYVGNLVNFTTVLFSLSTEASTSIAPSFFYCNSSSAWQSFAPSDGTSGFVHSGSITFTNPTNRGTCNQEIDGTPLADTTQHTYIAIQRTEPIVTIIPTVTTSVLFKKSSSYVIGNDGLVEADFAMGFINEEFQPEGSITHYFESKDIAGSTLTNLWTQTGMNNSYSAIGNSFGVVPNYMGKDNFSTANGRVNMTQLINYPLLCLTFGVDCVFNADTVGNAIDLIPGGPLLWTMGDLEVWQSAKIHKGISVEESASFVMDGNEFNIFNGSLLLQTPRDFEQGFTEGDEVTIFTTSFPGSISPFSNIQSSSSNWKSISNALCDDGQCASSNGIAGTGGIIMQNNVSTSDVNETKLSFVYSLVGLVGGDTFDVVVNNNIGSGDVTVFTDSGTDALVPQVISLPSSMDDVSILTISFDCGATSAIRDCYVDNVKLNGTAISTTLINVTGSDSVINMGDGTLAADGFPAIGIFYDAENDTIVIRGNVTQTETAEVDLNVTTSITLQGETINFWANITQFVTNMLLTDGSRSLTSNWDQGTFNLTNVNSWFLGKVDWATIQNKFSGSTTDDLAEGSVNLYDNRSWNESLADTLYANISVVDTNCSVTGSCSNVVYNLSAFDTDDLAEGSVNLYDNQSWNQSHANTLYDPLGSSNSSFNQSLTDSLYIAQANEGNLNVNSSDFWDDLDSPADINGGDINNNLNWINQSQVNLSGDDRWILQSNEGNLNVNSSDFWDELDTINTTQMEDNGGTLNILVSWFTSQWNDIFSTKDTDDLAEGSINLYDNRSFNQSLTDTLYDAIGSSNSSFNQTLTDSLYIAQANEGNLDVNRSDFWDDLDTPADINGGDINNNLNWINASDETDPLWSANFTNVAFTNVDETFDEDLLITKNLTVRGNNISLGSSEIDQSIWFYDSGGLNERLFWDTSPGGFVLTGQLNMDGNAIVSAGTTSVTSLLSSGTIRTTSSGDDLWLGALSQSSAPFQAFADGSMSIATRLFNVTTAGILNSAANITTTAFFVGDGSKLTGVSVVETDPVYTAEKGDIAFTNISETFDEHLSITKNLTVAGNNISLGSSEIDQCIYFYEAGSLSESLCWDTSGNDEFAFSDILDVDGLQSGASGVITNGDIRTNTGGADLWLGNTVQSSALFKAYANGTLQLKDIFSTDNITAGTFFVGDGSKLTGIAAGNSSFNQTLTDSLYIAQSNEANLNVNKSDFWDDLDIFNSTQMENNGGTLNIITSWFSSFFDTLFSAKDTDDLSEGSTNLYDNRSWNQTLADSIYAPILISLPAANVTSGTFGTGNYIFDTNVTVDELVFEDDASHSIKSNSTCVIIKGDTSTFEVC